MYLAENNKSNVEQFKLIRFLVGLLGVINRNNIEKSHQENVVQSPLLCLFLEKTCLSLLVLSHKSQRQSDIHSFTSYNGFATVNSTEATFPNNASFDLQ